MYFIIDGGGTYVVCTLLQEENMKRVASIFGIEKSPDGLVVHCHSPILFTNKLIKSAKPEEKFADFYALF